MKQEETGRFFTRDRQFYKSLFSMMILIALQNLVAYSVNMADNIMLGRYSQDALSGAASVNQIFFMVQQFAMSIGNSLVVLASQYWGKKEEEPIRKLTAVSLKLGLGVGAAVLILCQMFPYQLVGLFTKSEGILAQGVIYLKVVSWSFFLYILSNVFISVLRSVGIVKISFYISIVSLIVNVGINYTLIYGRFGMPEMGVRGAGIGTLTARILELIIVVCYLFWGKTGMHFWSRTMWKRDRQIRKDYTKVYLPIFCAFVLWGFSVPVQTGILGRLSDNAIAANSVATTFYQYLKVIVVAMSNTASVLIGNAVGAGDLKKTKEYGRTISVICIGVGIVLGIALIALRYPLLSLYNLSEDATTMALHLIVIMGFIMMGMSYQMPVSAGIIQGGGDTTFLMKLNLISTWLIVMPLSFASAFWWKWPVELVVICVQSDQVFKCLPVYLHFRKYQWIKKLTR